MPLDRQTIENFRSVPKHLRRTGLAVPARRRTICRAARRYSLAEHARHLRDYEVEGIQPWIERMLVEGDPVPADFPGDRLALEWNDTAEDFGRTLGNLEHNRDESIRILSPHSDQQLDRTTRSRTDGRIALQRLIEIFSNHELSNCKELDQRAAERQADKVQRAR